MSTSSTPPAETLIQLLHERYARGADSVAIHIPRGDAFSQRTWREVFDDVYRFAAALEALGVAAGDRVAQIAENRYEWLLADLAIQSLRAIHVPIHASLSAHQILFQIADTEPRVLLLAGPPQLEKLAIVLRRLPGEMQIVSYDAPQGGHVERPVHLLSDLLRGAESATAERIARESLRNVESDDLATILYSSGTTGEPKGVMLSQRNLTFNAIATVTAFDPQPDDLQLCWLPLSHIFARTADMYCWLATGIELGLATSRERIIANCGQLRPTLINGVPYFYDKVYRTLARPDSPIPPSKLKDLLGGRVSLCCSGGAPLADETAEFFWQNGVPLVQGYGLTESSPIITTSTLEANKRGSVGRALPGVEVRIAEDGEILTRGKHVMAGYWRHPLATEVAIRDGWLHTGDVGELDADGFLRITGRKKELIVTSCGKKISPSHVEGLITSDPLIAQAVVLGEGRNFLTALIVPNFEALAPLATQWNLPPDQQSWLAEPRVVAEFERRIGERLTGLAHEEQVAAFALLTEPFSQEREELTPTLKVRRSVIVARYAERIAQMYAQADAARPAAANL